MSETDIHPTAFIADSAELGQRVIVGAYAIIEDHVEIGDDSIIYAHAVIHQDVTIGNQNEIFPNAVIGGLPQDLTFDRELKTSVSIGDSNMFREGVTVNRATKANSATQIGSRCFFMNNTHVAHDCMVGDDNIFATGATLGGHVHVGDQVFFGGGVMVHQFCRIGSLAIIRGVTGVSMDVLPYSMVGGLPARHYRLNTVGLRRAKIKGDRYRILSQAFRRLKERKPIDDLGETPELGCLRDWLAEKSIRGIHAFAATNKNKE